MENENLKDFVKKRRKALKITQETLANKSGIGLHFIRDIEQGKQRLNLQKVNQLLFMFGAKKAPVPLSKEDRLWDTFWLNQSAIDNILLRFIKAESKLNNFIETSFLPEQQRIS